MRARPFSWDLLQIERCIIAGGGRLSFLNILLRFIRRDLGPPCRDIARLPSGSIDIFQTANDMKIGPKSALQYASLWLTALTLTACSTNAPYMISNSGQAGSGLGNGETPVVQAITEKLIREQKTQREQQVGQELDNLVGVPRPYMIGPGDIILVVIWGHPELVAGTAAASQPTVGGIQPGAAAEQTPFGFMVGHDGMLQYPFVGSLQMVGLTEGEARELLSTKIARYINHPNVTLRIQSYRSKRIYIDGEVKTPGLEAINDLPMSLMEALNRAGGVLPTGDQSQIKVTRAGANYIVNLPKLIQRGVDPASLLLINGDVVRVPSRDDNKVFVTGEVTTPKSLTMHNGALTLNEALGESGGVNPLSGDPRQIYVVRKVGAAPVVYRLDAKSTDALAIAEGFELNPRDLIYVAPTALTDWHRTISLLLPEALSTAVGAGRAP